MNTSPGMHLPTTSTQMLVNLAGSNPNIVVASSMLQPTSTVYTSSTAGMVSSVMPDGSRLIVSTNYHPNINMAAPSSSVSTAMEVPSSSLSHPRTIFTSENGPVQVHLARPPPEPSSSSGPVIRPIYPSLGMTSSGTMTSQDIKPSLLPSSIPSPPSGSRSSAAQGIAATSSSSGMVNTTAAKLRLQELVKEVDPNEQLDEEVEDALLSTADMFIDSVVDSACKMAKHRGGNCLEAADVQFVLEHQWGLWLPGFGSEIKPYKKSASAEAHKQRMAIIRKTLKK